MLVVNLQLKLTFPILKINKLIKINKIVGGDANHYTKK